MAVGTFVSDAVLLLRTRPIHNVSVAIEFGRPVIEWYRANCLELVTKAVAKATGDYAFCLQITIVFNYFAPPEDPSLHGDYYYY